MGERNDTPAARSNIDYLAQIAIDYRGHSQQSLGLRLAFVQMVASTRPFHRQAKADPSRFVNVESIRFLLTKTGQDHISSFGSHRVRRSCGNIQLRVPLRGVRRHPCRIVPNAPERPRVLPTRSTKSMTLRVESNQLTSRGGSSAIALAFGTFSGKTQADGGYCWSLL